MTAARIAPVLARSSEAGAKVQVRSSTTTGISRSVFAW